jgi:hypothetical protein
VFDLKICTWLASRISLHGLQVKDIFFDKRIEILTLTNLYLDICKGICRVTSKSIPGRPAGSAAGGLQVNQWAFSLP